MNGYQIFMGMYLTLVLIIGVQGAFSDPKKSHSRVMREIIVAVSMVGLLVYVLHGGGFW